MDTTHPPRTFAAQIHILRHALTHNPELPGDDARATGVHVWAAARRDLLDNILESGSASYELIVFGLIDNYIRHKVVPTATEFETRLAAMYYPVAADEVALCREYASVVPTLSPVDVQTAQATLDVIVDRLTYNADSNPDGPIYRSYDGKFLPSSVGPRVSGTPTERLVWLGLYHYRDGIGGEGRAPIFRLAEELGCSLQATKMAVNGLKRRGIARGLDDSPDSDYGTLFHVYTASAADARVAWQRSTHGQGKNGGCL